MSQHLAPSSRQKVVGPQIPPTAEEALLDPRRGHLRGGSHESEADAEVLALISAKLRIAVAIGVGFFVLLVTVCAALALSTYQGPLMWIIPGVVLYPIILAAGRFYLLRILRYDRAYRRRRSARAGTEPSA